MKTTKRKTTRTTQQRPAIRTNDGEPHDPIVVGRFVGTLGLRGELKVAGTRLAFDALAPGTKLVLTREREVDEAVVATVRQHGGRLVLTLEGAADRTAAERLVGFDIAVDRDAIRMAPQEHLDVDLVGSRLVDEAGNELGTVSGVAHYPAQDCLVMAGSGALVPLVRAFVRSIDPKTKTIVVALPPGLLDPREALDARHL